VLTAATLAAGEVKSWFDEELASVSLLAQVLAVLLAAAVLFAVLHRMGARVPLQRAAAVGVLAFLTIQAGGALRERWDGLNRLEAGHERLSAKQGREACLGTGADGEAVAWAAARMPKRARFVLPPAPSLVAGPGTCIRFLLLPRLQVASEREADYVLIWEPNAALATRLREGGAVLETFKDRYVLARLP
jgi:hypothetical protein